MSLDTFPTVSPTTVTTLVTTTLDNRRNDLQDAIFNDLAIVKFLKGKGQVILEGGATIMTPLMYAKNTTAQFYNGYEQLDTTPQEGFTMSQYEWKESAVSISVSNREENIQNNGKEAVLNIVDQKIKQAEMSLKDLLNTQLFDSSPAAKEIGSLVTTIDATSSIGAINSTTYSWWQSDVNSGGSFAAQGLSDMRTLHSALLVVGAKTDAIVTRPTEYNYYEGSLVPQLRFQGSSSADGSFGNITFRTIPIIQDTASTSGVMYFIDSRHLMLYVHSKANLSMSEWVKPSNQTAKTAQIILACELATNNRRRLGKITTISA